MTFTLLKTASTLAQVSTIMLENLQQVSSDSGYSLSFVIESITQLLANIAMTAETGNPIKLMHLNSVGALLAGVDAISTALPSSTDSTKLTNTLRVLATAGLSTDGNINSATYPIISLGAKNATLHSRYSDIVKQYADSQTKGAPDGEPLVRTVRQLQSRIDKSIRLASNITANKS